MIKIKPMMVAAIKSSSIVRIERSKIEPGWADGFIVDLKGQFFLFQNISAEIFLNGFSALRVKDCTSLESPAPYAKLLKRALDLRGIRPRKAIKIDLRSWKTIAISSGKKFPLISVHMEEKKRGVCTIGKFIAASNKTLAMVAIGPDGVFDRVETQILFRDITRIDFGGGYEEALALVAYN